jgi:hypothetical protein
MKALLIGWMVVTAAVLWWARPPSFEQRWAPAIEHPLHSVSAARTSFCYPAKCLNG